MLFSGKPKSCGVYCHKNSKIEMRFENKRRIKSNVIVIKVYRINKVFLELLISFYYYYYYCCFFTIIIIVIKVHFLVLFCNHLIAVIVF